MPAAPCWGGFAAPGAHTGSLKCRWTEIQLAWNGVVAGVPAARRGRALSGGGGVGSFGHQNGGKSRSAMRGSIPVGRCNSSATSAGRRSRAEKQIVRDQWHPTLDDGPDPTELSFRSRRKVCCRATDGARGSGVPREGAVLRDRLRARAPGARCQARRCRVTAQRIVRLGSLPDRERFRDGRDLLKGRTCDPERASRASSQGLTYRRRPPCARS
jgi:hypothetical protein